jgi:transcription initiation factor TFIID subunit 1
MILVGHSIAFYHLLFIAHSTSNDFLSTLCSKEIENFNRPKAKWYPHENKIVAQLQGGACSHERMTVILMTLGGKGLKFVVNVVETPVFVK